MASSSSSAAANSSPPQSKHRELKDLSISSRDMTTSTTSLMSSFTSGGGGIPRKMSPDDHLLDSYDEHDDDESPTLEAALAVAEAGGRSPTNTNNDNHGEGASSEAGDEEFKPASIMPPREESFREGGELVESLTLGDVFTTDPSSPDELTANNLTKGERESMTLGEVFPSDNTTTNEGGRVITAREARRMKNHNSSSSANSDESSILLDVSWGSNQYDKALLLSSFDDMLSPDNTHAEDGRPRRIGGRVGLRASFSARKMNGNYAASGGGGVGGASSSMDDTTSSRLNDESHRSETTSNSAPLRGDSFGSNAKRGGGPPPQQRGNNTGGERTQRINASNIHHLESGYNDSSNQSTGMIPPVFKTIRRNSKALNQPQVVHVDGGGDVNPGESVSRTLGFRGSLRNKASSSRGASRSRRRLTIESNASTNTSGSRGRKNIIRRASDASNSSDHLTGFQVLTASFQSAREGMGRQRSVGSLDSDIMNDGNDVSGGEGYPQGRVPPPRSVLANSNRSGGSGGSNYSISKEYKMTSLRDVHGNDNNNIDDTVHRQGSTNHPDTVMRLNSRGNSSSGGSVDFSDSRRDAINCSSRIDDSEGRGLGMSNTINNHNGEDNADGNGRKEHRDSELVAEVGGTAYLRASRSVWAMRIIMVITFVVVSVIVTVLTYSFFRSMESGVISYNFIEISASLVANTVKCLEDKALSARTLSTMYTGILGTSALIAKNNNNGTEVANHSPLVMLSSSTKECAVDPVLTGWPNVTLPSFDAIASSMLGASSSRAIVFAPLVRDDEASVLAWEEYAADNALPPVREVVSNGIHSSSSEESNQDPSKLAAANDNGGDRGLEEDNYILLELPSNSLSSQFLPSNSIRVPAWQIAPVELMSEGIMWDYYSHPPYQAAIDRLLKWNKEREQHGRELTDGNGQQASVAATELIPCDEMLLPLHLNKIPAATRIKLTGPDGRENHGMHRRRLDHEESLRDDMNNPNAHDVCSAIFHPVYDAAPTFSSKPDSENSLPNITGVVAEVFSWTDILKNIITGSHQTEVRVVITSHQKLSDSSDAHKLTSFYVTEYGASYIGNGRSAFEETHEAMKQSYDFSFGNDDGMIYTFEVYPTDMLCVENGVSNRPMFLAIIAACFFFLSVAVFFVYDYFVNYRQKVVVRSAARSARIVHSLYPQFVRDNLFGSDQSSSAAKRKDNGGAIISQDGAAHTNSTQEYDEEDPRPGVGIITSVSAVGGGPRRKGLKSKVSDFVDTPATQLKRFLTHPMPSREYDYNLCMEIAEMEPIAEVFEKTTVMLADIEGFTAWCSEREPSQVFRLLETVYREFDIEARKLGVFKVETVGDCYVAVTGLPDPRDDHAIVIAKYAVRCLLKFNVLTKRLEANLGPGTASLGMRFGLHSGPVTAGVLRGEKSRFQLFGDTINVASRMESTGEKNMIQVSQDTADLLNASGKGHWLMPREGPVSAKGKGSIQTYWLQPKRRRPSMHGNLHSNFRQSMVGEPVGISAAVSGDSGVPSVSLDRALRQSWKCIGIDNDSLVAKERLIRWNAAILESFLLKIVDNRNAHSPADDILDEFIPTQQDKILSFSEKLSEKVMFPHTAYRDDYYGVSTDISISSEAQIELLEYVARIASMYRDVPFHNFDHASHVTMSANKLLNRVCTTFEDEEEDIASVAARTFGISADPLAQFVVVFSSLVHDVDHQGVPNAQLVKEEDPLAAEFDNRSVAEKRSITIAWNMLMEDRFRELQSLIFVNGEEMRRFKQLLVNTVLATDIADKERSKVGKIRWQKAFHPSQSSHGELDDSTRSLDEISMRSLKATLVFEQIMQASDVAHTMQHWETFKKWNKRLYAELSKGYREGRGATDPRENWYGGEIGFFDFYIIPLAKKLRECGVFGSAASEYLDYALENRRRWEEEGKDIARKMVAEHDKMVAKLPPEGKEAEPPPKALKKDNGQQDQLPGGSQKPEAASTEAEELSPQNEGSISPDPGEIV